MTDNQQILSTFSTEVQPSQLLWALQDKKSEDWVVLDSLNYEKTEVMPLWSSEERAAQHCTEEWADYIPTAITVADWLEFWINDLLEDGVIIGLNWLGDDNDCEIDLPEFTQALADIEAL